MKNLLTLCLICLLSIQLYAAELVLIPTTRFDDTRQLFNNPSVEVHFYRDEFAIATLNTAPKSDYITLDANPWQADFSYYLVYLDEWTDKQQYTTSIEHTADILYDGSTFLIVRTNEKQYGQLPPAKNDGMVRIFQREALLADSQPFLNTLKSLEADPFVIGLLDQVNATFISDRVQLMEDYGTRNAYAPESIEAQEWIEEQFLSWGLEVEVMDFSMPNGPASDNVIATLTGTKYPDEYIVVGGHYDSVSWSGDAPGADDNASGTSGVMEIARILSQYSFDRTIIFCAFSGEEYGLYGSASYASRSAQQGMDILGYFNLDMIGYLQPGHLVMKSSLIYPQSAQELADFYTQVAGVYVPAFEIVPANFTGGDSDHTSFNNSGYMGIFPFEDVDNYSPHIHTSNDIIGPSYNNEAQAVVFTKASLAAVVTMANMLNPPRNLVAIPGDEKVNLSWDEMFDIDYFNIYRNGELLATALEPAYTDNEVENEIQYEYFVTAIYSDTGEESEPSNIAFATPMPPVTFPLFIDFENGAPYWELDQNWGLTTEAAYSPSHSLTESPSGNYENNREDHATLRPLNLTGYTDATLSFQTKYEIENNWDFMYLEVSVDGNNWTLLDTYTGTQSEWTLKTYSLADFINQPFVNIRFRFFSDTSIDKQGMFIDDFQITTEGGYHTQTLNIPEGWSSISSYLVPTDSQMENILQPIADELVILQSMDGVYWPDEDYNTMGIWNSNAGYKIKVNSDINLDISGTYAENTHLDIPEGWNLIPVLSQCPVSTDALPALTENPASIIKEIAGEKVFWPSQDVQTLEMLYPGKAYLLYADQAFTLEYPECNITKTHTTKSETASIPWDRVAPTGNSHLIAIPADAISSFEPGDHIGVFTTDGLCAGAITLDNVTTPLAMVVYANDSITSQKDGFLENENLSFRLHQANSGDEFALLSEFDLSFPHGGFFSSEGVSGLQSLIIDQTGIPEITNYAGIYPNPASDKITVTIAGERTASITISHIEGQVVKKLPVFGTVDILLGDFSAGVYLICIEGKNFTETHKVIVQ